MKEREEKIRNIIKEELYRSGFDLRYFYIFVSFLAVRSVGVMGDNRTYCNPVLIEVLDKETKTVLRIPYNILESIANRVANEVQDINRIIYDVTKLK